MNGAAVAAEDPYVWRHHSSGRIHLIFKAMQTILTHDKNKLLLVPGGWIGHTYSRSNWLDDGGGANWSQPSLAINRTLHVITPRTPPLQTGPADSNPKSVTERWSLFTGTGKATHGVSESDLVGFPAISYSHKSSRAGWGAGVAMADAFGRLKVERLERPQMLFGADGTTPIYCFAAVALKNSAANVVLQPAAPPRAELCSHATETCAK